MVLPIALANLMLHGIDQPNLWHGNTLTKRATYKELFEDAPATFDVILTNPPFGGKEGSDAQKNYAFQTSSTQTLFVQDILTELAEDGSCAIVLDDGFLFRKDENAFVETKRKLVDECDLWAIISLPGGVFSGAGAAVKTNLLFFTKGQKTKKIWYYDLTHLKVGKKLPVTLAHFGFAPDGSILADKDLPANLTAAWTEDEDNQGKWFPSYARLLSKKGKKAGESRYSWTVDFAVRRKQAREEMKPFLATVEQAKADIVDLKERLKEAKKKKAKSDVLNELTDQLKTREKESKEAQNKADAIGAAVFDLKAVNPNAVVKVDTRTPAEVIQSIEAHGKIVAKSLKSLKKLLSS